MTATTQLWANAMSNRELSPERAANVARFATALKEPGHMLEQHPPRSEAEVLRARIAEAEVVLAGLKAQLAALEMAPAPDRDGVTPDLCGR